MYARLVRFAFGPGKESAAQALADELAPLIRSQPGCQEVTIFTDEDGESGIFVLWATEAEANTAAQIVRPKLNAHLEGNVKGAPDARLFRVLS